MSITILGKTWFNTPTSEGPIGIVLVHNGFEEKAYIGEGIGLDEHVDVLRIVERGAKFPLEIAKRMDLTPLPQTTPTETIEP